MPSAALSSTLRMGVALSGGADSSMVALFLQRCVKTEADLRALRLATGVPIQYLTMPHGFRDGSAMFVPPPSLMAQAVQEGAPWSCVVREALATRGVHVPTTVMDSWLSLKRPVELYPLHMHCWDDEESEHGWCDVSRTHYEDAQRVAHWLGLLPASSALPVVHLAAAYADACFDPMLDAYATGRTLNVDVLCGSEVKFGAFLRRVVDAAGPWQVEVLATGHYARALPYTPLSAPLEEASMVLARPCTVNTDLNDQSVFLSRVPPTALAQAVFPLGHLFASKRHVRDLLMLLGRNGAPPLAHVARKKTSTGICFVEQRNRPGRTGGGARRRFASPEPVPPQPSRALVFGAYISSYVPLPWRDTPSAATRFVNAETGIEMDASGFDFGPVLPEGVHVIHPSRRYLFAACYFTPGQKLRYVSSSESEGKSRHTRTYFVKEKICGPLSVSPNGSLVIHEVRLVSRWDHPLLYSCVVHAREAVLGVPLRMLHTMARAFVDEKTGSSEGCGEDKASYRIRCACCTRHQEAPRLAWWTWRAADEESTTGVPDVLSRVVVHFDEPVRAVTPGQALVAYVPWARLNSSAEQPKCSTTELLSWPGDVNLCVVASAWIDAADAS